MARTCFGNNPLPDHYPTLVSETMKPYEFGQRRVHSQAPESWAGPGNEANTPVHMYPISQLQLVSFCLKLQSGNPELNTHRN